MKKDLVAKPNQLIEISGNVSAVQSKMYNVILARAHQELKKAPNKTEFYFDLEDIKQSAGVKDKNDNRLRSYLKKLSKVSIEYVDSKEHWGGFNLISEYGREEDKIVIELPRTIRKALASNNYYTTLDLLMLKSLESKYSIALYELALKYHKIQIPEYKVENFRKITDTLKSKSYDDFGMLQRRILKPSVTEINEKTDIELSYTLKKSGRKVVAIKFDVKKKSLPVVEVESLEPMPLKGISNDTLEAAIDKAKRNLYVSKAWNKRVDNKIDKIIKDEGMEFAVNLLKELYNNLKQEIRTTLVQYINGMIKQMKLDKEADTPKPKQPHCVEVSLEKPEELREEERAPEDSGVHPYKIKIMPLANKQVPTVKQEEFFTKLGGAKTKKQVDDLVLEYSINLELPAKEEGAC